MLDPAFRYLEPLTLAEATALLAAHRGDAVVVGGGTMLVPAMSGGALRPRLAIGLRKLGLGTIAREGDAIVIGAAVSYAQLIAAELVATQLPLLHAMARQITGGPQIRNQGTLAGSAAYANPCSDAPACLVALGAEIRLVGPAGERRVPATKFFVDAFRTARRDDELVGGIALRAQADARCSFRKLKHSEGSWPILTASGVALRDGVRVALGGFGPVPVVAEGRVGLAAALAAQVPDPWQDELADAAYRRFAVPALIARVVADVTGEPA